MPTWAPRLDSELLLGFCKVVHAPESYTSFVAAQQVLLDVHLRGALASLAYEPSPVHNTASLQQPALQQ